jgi:hypothetical protein
MKPNKTLMVNRRMNNTSTNNTNNPAHATHRM